MVQIEAKGPGMLCRKHACILQSIPDPFACLCSLLAFDFLFLLFNGDQNYQTYGDRQKGAENIHINHSIENIIHNYSFDNELIARNDGVARCSKSVARPEDGRDDVLEAQRAAGRKAAVGF